MNLLLINQLVYTMSKICEKQSYFSQLHLKRKYCQVFNSVTTIHASTFSLLLLFSLSLSLSLFKLLHHPDELSDTKPSRWSTCISTQIRTAFSPCWWFHQDREQRGNFQNKHVDWRFCAFWMIPFIPPTNAAILSSQPLSTLLVIQDHATFQPQLILLAICWSAAEPILFCGLTVLGIINTMQILCGVMCTTYLISGWTQGLRSGSSFSSLSAFLVFALSFGRMCVFVSSQVSFNMKPCPFKW